MTQIIIRGLVQLAYAHLTLDGLSLDKEWLVRIERYRKPRSLDQNALFHKWISVIATETGNDFEDTKEALKALFLPARFVEIDGKTIEVRRSTAALKVDEMREFCTRIQAWAAQEMGIELPTRLDLEIR